MKKLLVLLVFIAQVFALQANKENVLKLEKQHIPIVDIRTPGEWQATGTIPGALKITFFTRQGINQNFEDELKAHHLDKNSKFAVICRTGHRSTRATQILKSEGYKNVINLEGGMYGVFKSLLKDLKNGK